MTALGSITAIRVRTDWTPDDARELLDAAGWDHPAAALAVGQDALAGVMLVAAAAARGRAAVPRWRWLRHRRIGAIERRITAEIVAEHTRRQELLLAVVRAHTETEGD